jgi:hypothetical protein
MHLIINKYNDLMISKFVINSYYISYSLRAQSQIQKKKKNYDYISRLYISILINFKLSIYAIMRHAYASIIKISI